VTPKDAERYFLVSNDIIIPLANNDGVVLGRDPALCNFVLADERISRIHAMVYSKDGRFFVKDLNSSNGIVLNGKRVQESASLTLGDVVEIRPFKLQFV
jgi:pSer/pThr/pTyr-binding forkhead associated (FHA) protein